MRQRYEIFESLKSSFLSTQNSLNQILPGTIINSLLYANSVELALAFDDIDALKDSMYIDSASGVNLDFLIRGFSQISRIPEKNSVGYVLIELGNTLTSENVDSLNFSFSQYTEFGTVNTSYPNVVVFSVNNKNGGSSNYTLVNPLNFSFQDRDFSTSSLTASQQVLSSYKEYIKVLYNKYKKPIKYLVLPIASIAGGSSTNVPSGSIDAAINLGVPCTVTNPFLFSSDARKAYLYLKDNSVVTDVIMADIDGIINGGNDSYGLENFSYISGGSDVESDESYRSRYYNYLNSLSKGTVEAIRTAISSQFPNFSFSLVETPILGSLDVYVDTNYVLSRPVLQRVQNAIAEVKPVGIAINVKPTKTIFVSAVTDLVSESFNEDVSVFRENLNDIIGAKELQQSLTYEELLTTSSNIITSKKDNVFYGEFLNASLFNMYKETFQKLYAKFGITAENITESSTYWKNTTYFDVYNSISTKENSVYLAYSGSNIKYPLIGLIRKALAFTEQEKTSLNTFDLELVNLIQSSCITTKPSQCLAKIIPNSNSYNESSIEPPAYNSIVNFPKLSISLGTLSRIVGPEYANYYKIKLLTIPFIRQETEENAIPLIRKIISNDVVYFAYDDLTEATLTSLEKIKLMRDVNFSGTIYTSSSVVGARPLER
jgi:hypothetical protein